MHLREPARDPASHLSLPQRRFVYAEHHLYKALARLDYLLKAPEYCLSIALRRPAACWAQVRSVVCV